jgi:hypothetical protein
MDGIQAPQGGAGGEVDSTVEQFTVQVQLVESGQLPPGQGNGAGTCGCYGPNDFNAGQCARGSNKRPMAPEVTAQRARLLLGLHQLHQC